MSADEERAELAERRARGLDAILREAIEFLEWASHASGDVAETQLPDECGQLAMKLQLDLVKMWAEARTA